jgi:GTP cyclohydrolase II
LRAARALGPPPVVAITAWRAGTLKARAYDGDLARIVMPPDADATWLPTSPILRAISWRR